MCHENRLVELNKATHDQKTSIVHLAIKPLWERPPGPSQGAGAAWRPTERKYGAI